MTDQCLTCEYGRNCINGRYCLKRQHIAATQVIELPAYLSDRGDLAGFLPLYGITIHTKKNNALESVFQNSQSIT